MSASRRSALRTTTISSTRPAPPTAQTVEWWRTWGYRSLRLDTPGGGDTFPLRSGRSQARAFFYAHRQPGGGRSVPVGGVGTRPGRPSLGRHAAPAARSSAHRLAAGRPGAARDRGRLRPGQPDSGSVAGRGWAAGPPLPARSLQSGARPAGALAPPLGPVHRALADAE